MNRSKNQKIGIGSNPAPVFFNPFLIPDNPCQALKGVFLIIEYFNINIQSSSPVYRLGDLPLKRITCLKIHPE